MKRYIFILLTVVPALTLAQKPATKPTTPAGKVTGLPDFQNVVEVDNEMNGAAYAISASEMSAQMGIEPIEPDSAATKFLKSLIQKPTPEHIPPAELQLLNSNKQVLSEYLRTNLLMGSTPVLYCLAVKNTPVQFTNKNNTLNLLISGLAYNKAFNTQITTARKRAVKIVTEMVLPGLKKSQALLQIPGLQSISYTVMYSCRDFDQDKSLTNLNPVEIITMTAPVSLHKQYIAGQITEDAFIKQAEFFLKEYTSKNEIKRVELKVE